MLGGANSPLSARTRELMVNAVSEAVIATDATGLVTGWNAAAERCYGWTAAEALGRPAGELMAWEQDAAELAQVTHALLDGGSWSGERTMQPRHRTPFVASVRLTGIHDEETGAFAGVISVSTDVTALRSVDRRYRLIADTAQEGIWATDPDGRTLYANQRLADLLGRPLEDIFALRSDELISSVSREDVIARQSRRDRYTTDRYELKHVRPDGSARNLAVVASPFADEDEYLGSLAMISDVTDMRDAEAALRFLAYHDPATGLPNRSAMLAQLERPEVTADRPALLVVDIHQLQLVNDSLGHAAGEALVLELVLRWERLLGPRDMLARMGDDEFVFSVDCGDEADALIIADRILHTLEEPVQLDDRSFAVSAGIGIALAPSDDTCDAATQLRNADTAMFAAKSQGPGAVVVFTTALAEQTRTRLELSTDLKRALRRDELELRYQPVVDLDTGQLLGVEALCRWTHAERGVISPDEFIPLAEAGGLIDSLDRWVLRRACRDTRLMRAAGTLPDGAYVAVNVSASKLARPDFESAVRGALAENDLPARTLVLEVTESAVMDDPETARTVLEGLRELGVEVSIDDFGTGYSSLAYLRRLPFGTLKIDRSFVQHMTEDAGDQAIVTAVIDLAGALGAKTIAEGVETAADLALLRRLGCRAGQGFLWSPAVAPDALATLIAELPDRRFPVDAGPRPDSPVRLPEPRLRRFAHVVRETTPASGE